MLKTEFGAFKNDTTVKEYKEEEAPKEEIKIDWNPTTGEEEKESEQEKEKDKPGKKESKLKKALERLKQQQKKEEEEQEEFIGIKGGG